MLYFFFFQAEDGIRDIGVTGVQTCALPISRIRYHIISDRIDDAYYLVVAIEGGSDGPYQTSDKAEKDKEIKLKVGRYIRIGRDSRLPNSTEEFELLDRKSTRLNSSHANISYAVFCLKKNSAMSSVSWTRLGALTRMWQ